MSKAKKRCIISGISFVVFLLYILAIKTIDVTNLGPGVDIGWSKLNMGFHNAIGMHMKVYKITQVFGIVAFIPVAFFGLIGLIQLIQRKNPLKVDISILSLGGTYVLLGILYVFFDKVVINYRPVLMEGEMELEASFPSSHTMLACVVLGTAILTIDRYLKNEVAALISKIACGVVGVIILVGRTVCGVHWLTDIIGGIIISVSLIMLYYGVSEFFIQKFKKKKKKRRPNPNGQPAKKRPEGARPSGQRPSGQRPNGQPPKKRPEGARPNGQRPSGQPQKKRPEGARPNSQRPSRPVEKKVPEEINNSEE